MAATLKDLARETGLGLATLSKYFNGGTVREKNRVLIEAAVKKLHYMPNEVARSLKTQQTRVIGVIIPELSNAFITSIISSMEDILRKQDYAVIVCDCRSDAKREKEAVEFLLHRRVDGLINMATDTSGAHLKAALSAGIPVLVFRNDFWIFDWRTDPVILILPDTFFLHCAVLIFALVFLFSIVMLILYKVSRIKLRYG